GRDGAAKPSDAADGESVLRTPHYVITSSVLLTDSPDESIALAVERLDGWRLERRKSAELPAAIGTVAGTRAVYVCTNDPTLLRATVERAHGAALPVVVECEDEAERRRAVELRAEEWVLRGAKPEEIAARVHGALARGTPTAAGMSDRVERVEYERMLHDSLTGLPTLPVMIERSRQRFKERGEIVVLYFNFVRYSKIEEC